MNRQQQAQKLRAQITTAAAAGKLIVRCRRGSKLLEFFETPQPKPNKRNLWNN